MRIFVTVRRMAAGLIWAMALLGAGGARAAPTAQTPKAAGAGRALTIYNQNFAVVRETVRLDLKAGENAVTFSDITAHLEPDSVVLRDPTGKRNLQMLEQNYRADALSQGLLLSLYEGKTIDFLVNANPNGFGQTAGGSRTQTVRGKIIRSGYVPHTLAYARYGQSYYQSQAQYSNSAAGQPVVEVDGKIQFGLPGQPVFPTLADDTILKPTLDWTLQTDKGGPLDAELAYVTGGMTWEADYNIVMPETGQTLDMTGLVTLDNQSGRTFENAKIKLMAGDVNKITPNYNGGGFGGGGFARGEGSAPPVTEKAFDEYHLYTLARPTTLRDRETKQVEFVRAHGILSEAIYVYDGLKIGDGYNNYSSYEYRTSKDYGTLSNPKVWTMREFANTETNGLGIPLPKGRMRFYRRDADGQLEFTGENTIDHTARGETIRAYTGSVFDMTGERKQTSFKVDSTLHTIDESFQIKLRNQKKEAVSVRVVEHLYRGLNWDITAKSTPFVKNDYNTIEFRVIVEPNIEKTVTYTVHYTW